MSVLSSGVRVGAAAFAVGLSLAGPQALGVAAADSSDASSVSSDARNTGAGRAGSVERSAAARSVRRAGLGGAPRASAAASVAESAGRSDGRSAPGLVQGRRVTTRAVATPGVVTGGVTSAAVNVSSDAGVGGRLFGGPVANAATSAAPAAATTASTRRPVTRRPTAAPPSDLNPVATANAQINSAFDSLANMLSGLPRGPVADFLGGALLLVRRSLFNQAPTANPVQYGQTETDIVGTLGAFDVEGNPITYIVSQAPQHGTVSIAADGFYTYIPDAFSATDSTDTFTVSVADSATRLLGPISTNVVVPVSISGAEAPPLQWPEGKTGFTVYNWTQYSIKLLGIGGDYQKLDARPADGTEVGPGHSFYFMLDKGIFNGYVVKPDFIASNGDYLRTELSNLRYGGDTWSAKLLPGTQTAIIGSDWQKAGPDQIKFFLLDPPNTSAPLPADKQAQTDLINWMCGGGPGNCSFKANIDGVRDVPGSAQLGSSGENKTDNQMVQSFTYSFSETASETSSWEINSGVKAKLGDKAGILIGGKYGRSYTYGTTAIYSETITRNLAPWSFGAAFATPSFASVTGDVIVTVWNTTWTFKNVQYNFPAYKDCVDKTCTTYKGKVQFRQEPLKDGMKLSAVLGPLPNEPVYYMGDPSGDSYALKLTAFNGTGPSGASTAADYTTKVGVKYVSSDPSVATVSERGVLTVLSPGSTKIKATYEWSIGGVTGAPSAELPVTVKPPKQLSAA